MDDMDYHLSFHRVAIQGRTWLSRHVFELRLEKPAGFLPRPGQKILCKWSGSAREYTLVSAAQEKCLRLCIQKLNKGAFSTMLALLKKDEILEISDPYGFFLYQPGSSVFVATGTGIAPFVAYAKAGVKNFILLHGVKSPADLHYRSIMADAAALYVPCISDAEMGCGALEPQIFAGRVTRYLQSCLPAAVYNFYLCGNGAMIEDATSIIDERFPHSKIFLETFYT